VHFASLWTGMTHHNKFRNRWCTLLDDLIGCLSRFGTLMTQLANFRGPICAFCEFRDLDDTP
jgi:hypothetical protein